MSFGTIFFVLAPYSKYNVTVNAKTKAGDGGAVSTFERTNESSKLFRKLLL